MVNFLEIYIYTIKIQLHYDNVCCMNRILDLVKVGQYPVYEVRHPGVDPRIAGLSASVTETHNPNLK